MCTVLAVAERLLAFVYRVYRQYVWKSFDICMYMYTCCSLASNQAPSKELGPGRDCMRMRQNSQKTWDKKCLVDKKYNGSFKSTIVLRFSYLRP